MKYVQELLKNVPVRECQLIGSRIQDVLYAPLQAILTGRVATGDPISTGFDRRDDGIARRVRSDFFVDDASGKGLLNLSQLVC